MAESVHVIDYCHRETIALTGWKTVRHNMVLAQFRGIKMTKYFDVETIREIMNFTETEIEDALNNSAFVIKDDWKTYFTKDNVDSNFVGLQPDILARAITYGLKKYPIRQQDIGIFATVVEAYTTGAWVDLVRKLTP